MIYVNGNISIQKAVETLLEKKANKLLYKDGAEKTLLNTQHLFDLFISGVPADSTISSLIEKSPALCKSETLYESLFKDSLRYFISTFDSLHDGILIADKNEVVRYINKSFERISGAKFSTTVGQVLSIARPRAKLGSVIRNETPLLGVKRKFGNIEYITDMQPIFINGVCVGGITVARDITEIQNLQTKLSKYRIRYNNLLHKINSEHTAKYVFNDIIGQHPLLIKNKNLAKKIAKSKMPVLIRGESGTGKELFAHAIHQDSHQSNGPFVTVNCAAIPTPLLESELFGYTEGAFSGAKTHGKQGLITMANNGTLFLDEVGNMDIDIQAKLLRVLQFGEVQPLGSENNINVDVRFIAATNADLEKKIINGTFRQDFFYRLNVSQITIPPLRERRQDILLLANYFLNKLFVDHPFAPLSLSEKTKEILYYFPWRGNVRELENTINFIGNITDSKEISSNCLPPIFYEVLSEVIEEDIQKDILDTPLDLKIFKKEKEKYMILNALDKYGRSVENKRAAARALGISLTTLYSKMAVYNIT